MPALRSDRYDIDDEGRQYRQSAGLSELALLPGRRTAPYKLNTTNVMTGASQSLAENPCSRS